MRVTREQMADNRRRILEAAGKLFREKGYDAVTVAEVMQAADLTHGGFYGHFTSKDDLIAAALGDVFDHPPAEVPFRDVAARYLSPRHRDDRGNGCPMAALGGETVRQPPEARQAMTEGLRRQFDRLARTAPGVTPAERRRAAIGAWSAMVGGLILARVSDDPKLSDEILRETRAWIDAASPEPAPRRKLA